MKGAKAAHSEDWSHLGKPDTGAAVANTGRGLLSGIRSLFRRAVRYETGRLERACSGWPAISGGRSAEVERSPGTGRLLAVQVTANADCRPRLCSDIRTPVWAWCSGDDQTISWIVLCVERASGQ